MDQIDKNNDQDNYKDKKYEEVKDRVQKMKKFYHNLWIYLIVNLCLFVLNMIQSPHQLWFYWVLIFWGLGIAINAYSVFWSNTDWEERKIKQLMDKEKKK